MRMRFFLFLRLNTVFELLYKRAILSTICQQSFGTLGNMGYLRFIIRKNSCIKIENRYFCSGSLIFHKNIGVWLFFLICISFNKFTCFGFRQIFIVRRRNNITSCFSFQGCACIICDFASGLSCRNILCHAVNVMSFSYFGCKSFAESGKQ